MKKVGIVGNGYLGKAFTRFFQDHYEVRVYDIKNSPNTKEEIKECDLVVICVPTNSKPDGSADTSAVDETLSWLLSKNSPLIVIKSAVPPSWVGKYPLDGICISPEYMGESKYFTPFWKYPSPTDGKMHNFLVMGGEEPWCSASVNFFLAVMGPDCRVVKMSALEASIVKYMENSWGATKVTFCNEFFEICKVFNADYQKVREGFLADSRVERMHTMILPDKRGFGGKCFPKDVAAILHASAQKGYKAELLRQVLHSNEEFIKKNI